MVDRVKKAVGATFFLKLKRQSKQTRHRINSSASSKLSGIEISTFTLLLFEKKQKSEVASVVGRLQLWQKMKARKECKTFTKSAMSEGVSLFASCARPANHRTRRV